MFFAQKYVYKSSVVQSFAQHILCLDDFAFPLYALTLSFSINKPTIFYSWFLIPNKNLKLFIYEKTLLR